MEPTGTRINILSRRGHHVTVVVVAAARKDKGDLEVLLGIDETGQYVIATRGILDSFWRVEAALEDFSLAADQYRTLLSF